MARRVNHGSPTSGDARQGRGVTGMCVEEATVVTRWDDLEILRLIDKLQEQHGGGSVWSRMAAI
jgi:hypothetical protein